MVTDNIRGLVIRSVDYGETSKIITIFSESNNFESVLAKGVKTPKSKKINLSSLFTEVDLEVSSKGELKFLKDGSVVNSNVRIIKSIENITFSQFCVDIIERTLVQNEENQDVYKLLLKTLDYLENTENKIRLMNMFLIKYISMIGFKPNLNYCVSCGDKISENIYFSFSRGGIVCVEDRGPNSILLKSEEYVYFKTILLEIFENIDIIYGGIKEEKIFRIIIDFLRFCTDISMPKSYSNFLTIFGIE